MLAATLLTGICFHDTASPLYLRCLSGLPCVYFASLYTGDSSVRIRCVSCTDLFQRFYPLPLCLFSRNAKTGTWLKARRLFLGMKYNMEALNYEQCAIVRIIRTVIIFIFFFKIFFQKKNNISYNKSKFLYIAEELSKKIPSITEKRGINKIIQWISLL